MQQSSIHAWYLVLSCKRESARVKWWWWRFAFSPAAKVAHSVLIAVAYSLPLKIYLKRIHTNYTLCPISVLKNEMQWIIRRHRYFFLRIIFDGKTIQFNWKCRNSSIRSHESTTKYVKGCQKHNVLATHFPHFRQTPWPACAPAIPLSNVEHFKRENGSFEIEIPILPHWPTFTAWIGFRKCVNRGICEV